MTRTFAENGDERHASLRCAGCAQHGAGCVACWEGVADELDNFLVEHPMMQLTACMVT